MARQNKNSFHIQLLYTYHEPECKKAKMVELKIENSQTFFSSFKEKKYSVIHKFKV